MGVGKLKGLEVGDRVIFYNNLQGRLLGCERVDLLVIMVGIFFKVFFCCYCLEFSFQELLGIL